MTTSRQAPPAVACSCGTRNECDLVLALLSEYAEEANPNNIKMGALLGLGLAYAGAKKEEVLEALMPVVANDETPLEVAAIASLKLGLCFAGSCNEDVSQALMTLPGAHQAALQKDPMTRLICLVGLIYLGKQQAVEVALELQSASRALWASTARHARDVRAAGTGNVLKVQRLP